jgi:hypothetical protein
MASPDQNDAGRAIRAAAVLSAPHPDDHWFVVTMGGDPVGSYRESFAGREGAVEGEVAMTVVLNRMGSLIRIATSATTREHDDGRLIEVGVTMEMSDQGTRTRAVVVEDRLKIEMTAGGRTFEKTIDLTDSLLGPAALARLSARELVHPGDRIAATIFSPELGTPAKATRELVAVEFIEERGSPVSARKVMESLEGAPVPTTLWLDGHGRILRFAMPGPFGEVLTYRAGEAEARRAEGGAALPEESFGSSLVRTQVRIPSARRLESMTVALRHRRPDLGWPAFDGPGQQVISRDAERLVLAVTRPGLGAPQSIPVAVTDQNRVYLEPNAWLQSDDPALVDVARSIVGDEWDLWRAAKMLERWVAESMTFDMGVVLAPSVEVFEKRRGTCTEYAMLLTTLARAAGIPARYVMGYVYVGGMFGGHAWTEVLLGDRWLPIDGAVIAEGPADAARFAFLWSSLDEGVGRLSLGPGAAMYGQIDLDVLEYRVEGEAARTLSPGGKPWTVEGNLFRDRGLGLELRRPEGFVFTGMDNVWPETIIVGLEDGNGRRASLTQGRRRYWEEPEAAATERLASTVPGGTPAEMAVRDRRAITMESPGRAALALPIDGDIWILTVEGDEASALLRRIAAGIRFGAGDDAS